MANTLETKTIEQLHTALVSYNSYMCEIPDSFPVLPEYLHGLTETEFCRAFAHGREDVDFGDAGREKRAVAEPSLYLVPLRGVKIAPDERLLEDEFRSGHSIIASIAADAAAIRSLSVGSTVVSAGIDAFATSK